MRSKCSWRWLGRNRTAGSQYLRRVVEGLKAMAEERPAGFTLDEQDGPAHKHFPTPPVALGCCLMVFKCVGCLMISIFWRSHLYDISFLSWRGWGLTLTFQAQIYYPPFFLRLHSTCVRIFTWTSAGADPWVPIPHSGRNFGRSTQQYCHCQPQSCCWAGDRAELPFSGVTKSNSLHESVEGD